MKTRIILIGGFLGSGKTTLLWKMAKKLTDNGKKVGLITNDQASELVDTAFLSKSGGVTEEVSGSCFCCNFDGFTDAVIKMRQDYQADVIIAEPVGSCTDLSATVIQPLKDMFRDEFVIAPLHVLVDPARLKIILDGGTSGLHTSAAYIFRKQLEEADYIIINKADLLRVKELNLLKGRTEKEWPLAKVYTISGQNGDGVDNWIDEALKDNAAGTHLAEVDYETYAEGESVLGWLNAAVLLKSKTADWNEYMKLLLNHLSTQFDQMDAGVGHVKLMIESKENYIIGNLTGTRDTLRIRGMVDKQEQVKLTINARVEMQPQELENLIISALEQTCISDIQYEVQVLKCLQPGRPNPTYRYKATIG